VVVPFVNLCDRVREVCPEFRTLAAFERTATELSTRIGFLIEAIEQHRPGGD